MPIIKSAKKKLRQDVKRTRLNKKYKNAYKNIVDKVRKTKPKEAKEKNKLLSQVYSTIDKAVKKKVIHKNKGNRLKKSVARLLTK